jgi:hypothetical protein
MVRELAFWSAVILRDDWDTFCPLCPASLSPATGETYDFDCKNHRRRFRPGAV